MAGAPKVVYDPTINQATLETIAQSTITGHGPPGWCLWTLRPDGYQAVPHVFTADEIGDAIPDHADQEAVADYFRRLLMKLGYTVSVDPAPPVPDYIASWTLAPGQN